MMGSAIVPRRVDKPCTVMLEVVRRDRRSVIGGASGEH